MTGKELIKGLLDTDLSKEVKLYSLINMGNINTESNEFEFISCTDIQIDELKDVIFVCADY